MEYKHFSHKHYLYHHQVPPGQQITCSGCESPCRNSIYSCHQCNFVLHEHCGNANRYVKHPYHPSHPLILIPTPTYASGSFLCNACGATGTAFSYCCAVCEVDLHVHCAFLPPKVTHKAHPHELALALMVPDKGGSLPHACKICTKVLDSKYWAYCCAKCDYRVHTFCATTEVKPGLYQDDGSDSQAVAQQSGNDGQVETEIVLSEEAVVELYKLQIQMQMAEQLAQIMGATNLN